MISYAQALEIVLSSADPLGTVSIQIEKVDGFCLAQPVSTPDPIPRFDNSAVDGYGVMASDTATASSAVPVRLALIGTIGAGGSNAGTIKSGQAVKIFTGGAIPSEVDAVIMREDVRESDPIIVTQPVQSGTNIRRTGEEFKVGQVVLESGIKVTPAVIGLLAQLGVASVEVYRKPTVALIITGNEFGSSGRSLSAGQIYDCNTPALVAALKSLGIDSIETFRIEDAPDPLRACLKEALHRHDVIITVGGISMGDFDYVRPVLTALGVEQKYWQVAMKPGKPNYFGTYVSKGERKKLVFGLPGNPVSALVSFLLLVKPALHTILGRAGAGSSDLFNAKLMKSINSEGGRLEFVRGRLSTTVTGWEVEPVARQGSHMLGGLTKADCFIRCPEPAEHIKAGQSVAVQKIQWD
ncbi:MAG: molybdopterin molybdotransferase MoeA [candidate division Zixibacteria bacterium]|nr:molybdopterin molybdotransferase MoeA [candidate division Zixibacteria bacterium]